MGCLGVHFALTDKEVAKLRSLEDEDERIWYVQSVLEPEYFKSKEWLAQNDKAWDAMHRTLTDGRLAWESDPFPLSHVILGGELLYTESDYIMSLKSPEEVAAVAESLKLVTEDWFRTRYFKIDPEEYGFPLSENDFGYTWIWFEEVRELFLRAAAVKRHILFTADQ